MGFTSHSGFRANQLINRCYGYAEARSLRVTEYLDGEVTAAQRQQVEDWLGNDPEVQVICAAMKLRQGGSASATGRTTGGRPLSRCLTLEPPTASGCGLVVPRSLPCSSALYQAVVNLFPSTAQSPHRLLRQSNH